MALERHDEQHTRRAAGQHAPRYADRRAAPALLRPITTALMRPSRVDRIVRGPMLPVLLLTAAALTSPAMAAATSGSVATPPGEASKGPTEQLIRGVLSQAWQDATTTWHRMLGRRRYETELPQINFVEKIRPSHCYGLYVGAGPVYCSGNNTVFVSLAAMHKLSLRIGSSNHTGLAILVAHELGHHVQKVTGRFRVLSAMAQTEPRQIRELSLKFELEADCLAGVWARQSGGFGARVDVREEMRLALAAIGDDRIQMADRGSIDPGQFTHGSSEQRSRWFDAGFDSGDRTTCSVLESDVY